MLWNLRLLCFEVPKYSSVRLVKFVSLNSIICKVYCVPMSNVLSTLRIHPKIMCNCIHSESCKYFERRLNYRNIKSPLKIRCNLHNHSKNKSNNFKIFLGVSKCQTNLIITSSNWNSKYLLWLWQSLKLKSGWYNNKILFIYENISKLTFFRI